MWARMWTQWSNPPQSYPRDTPKGYCHVLVRDTVVSTVSSNMIFGEFEVFGLDAHSSLGGVMTVKTVEFCQVCVALPSRIGPGGTRKWPESPGGLRCKMACGLGFAVSPPMGWHRLKGSPVEILT